MEQETRRLIIDRLRHLMRVNPDVDTIKKLAERSGVGYGTVQRLLSENDESDISLFKLEKVASTFGLKIDELLGRPGSIKGLEDDEMTLLMNYRVLEKKDKDEVMFFTSSKAAINKIRSQAPAG